MRMIGLDVGFGFTKVVTEEMFFKFPSVVGSNNKNNFKVNDRCAPQVHEEAICVDGEKLLVGSSAIKHSLRIFSAREKDWIGSLAYRALLKHAFQSLNFRNGEEVTIVTGLPVNHYQKCKDRLASAIKRTADREVEVIVLLQPLGSYFDYLLNDDATVRDREFMQSRTGIIDIGYFTTDYITIANLEFVKTLHESYENGISTAYKCIARDLYNTYSLQRKIHEVEEVIKDGFVMVSGEKKGVGDIINLHLRELNREIETNSRSLWKEGTDNDNILITGGGAATLSGRLDFYRQIRCIQNPQYANARGYLKYGMRQILG